MAKAQGFGANSPHSSDPGQACAGGPLVGEVDPFTGPDGLLDLIAGFERQQGGITDQQGRIRLLEHGDGVGWMLDKGGVGAEEFAEEDLGVGERAARSGVGCNGADSFEGMCFFDDELNRADAVERSDGAAGDDGQIVGEGGDGDEAEVGATSEKLVGAERGLGGVEVVSLGEFCRTRRVLEVPHQRCGIEEVDGGYADGMG